MMMIPRVQSIALTVNISSCQSRKINLVCFDSSARFLGKTDTVVAIFQNTTKIGHLHYQMITTEFIVLIIQFSSGSQNSNAPGHFAGFLQSFVVIMVAHMNIGQFGRVNLSRKVGERLTSVNNNPSLLLRTRTVAILMFYACVTVPCALGNLSLKLYRGQAEEIFKIQWPLS